MKKNESPQIEQLRLSGHRITPFRRALTDLFSRSQRPLSIPELIRRLPAGMRAHKTTMYRELEFLTSAGIIHEIALKGGVVRYEGTSHGHHHHAVCSRCGKIVEVAIGPFEQSIDRFVSATGKKIGFSQMSHSFELYGICRACRGK